MEPGAVLDVDDVLVGAEDDRVAAVEGLGQHLAQRLRLGVFGARRVDFLKQFRPEGSFV
jgi:hypothetical protein